MFVVVLQVSGGELLDSFLRRRRPPFCWTACKRRMLSESGLAALRLASPFRGMTALWVSLWLFLLLPLCVTPARLPTAQPTGRTQCWCYSVCKVYVYVQLVPPLEQDWLGGNLVMDRGKHLKHFNFFHYFFSKMKLFRNFHFSLPPFTPF